MGLPFYHFMLLFYSCNFFALKSTLSDNNASILAVLWLMFALYILYYIYNIDGLCFINHSANICHLIGIFMPFTFNIIINTLGLNLTFYFHFCCSLLSKLWGMVKDREPYHATVYGIAKSWIQFNDWTKQILFLGSFSWLSMGYLKFFKNPFWFVYSFILYISLCSFFSGYSIYHIIPRML